MSEHELRAENARLRAMLREAEETLDAIRTGKVDALVVKCDGEEKVYILEGADKPYRIFFDQMNEGAATLSEEGIVVFTNKSFLEMLGLSRSISGQLIGEFIENGSLDAMNALIRNSASTATQGEIVLRGKNGDQIPARLSLNGLRVDGEQFICLTAEDLRERKRHEKAMEEAQQQLERKVSERTEQLNAERNRLETVINQMPVGVAVADAQTGTLSHVNREWERVFGRSIGGSRNLASYDVWKSCFHKEGRPYEEGEYPLIRGLRGETVQNEELRVLRGDGSWRIVRASAVPIKDGEGKTVAVVVVDTDVTDIKRMEKELQERADRLAGSNAELEQFAFVASHDLREPLRMVSIHLGLLEKRYRGKVLDEKAQEYIHFAIDGSKRMDDLINDLLAFSRVGTKGAPMEPTDMKGVLDETLTNLRLRIAETRAIVTSGGMPTVNVDRAQMRQVLQNLVDNALKFHGDAPPRVDVSATRANDGWVFAVKDNGIGIDPKYHNKIFELFTRLHTREEFEGTGIGLAVCRKIVERHGGRIWVESRTGEGSTFYFSIPENPPEQPVVAGR